MTERRHRRCEWDQSCATSARKFFSTTLTPKMTMGKKIKRLEYLESDLGETSLFTSGTYRCCWLRRTGKDGGDRSGSEGLRNTEHRGRGCRSIDYEAPFPWLSIHIKSLFSLMPNASPRYTVPVCHRLILNAIPLGQKRDNWIRFPLKKATLVQGALLPESHRQLMALALLTHSIVWSSFLSRFKSRERTFLKYFDSKPVAGSRLKFCYQIFCENPQFIHFSWRQTWGICFPIITPSSMWVTAVIESSGSKNDELFQQMLKSLSSPYRERSAPWGALGFDLTT